MMQAGPHAPAAGRLTGSYLWFEVLRVFRNRWFFMFAIGFPVVLYVLIAGANRNVDDFVGTGLSAPLYYMASIAAYGTMSGMTFIGARIAAERDDGWNRLLRTTPLSPRAYLGAKIVSAYLTVLASIGLLYISGLRLGVRLTAVEWLWMTALMLVALVPFGALGILFGHLLRADAAGAVTGVLVAVLAFVGGAWFPIQDGMLYEIGRFLPSYWLVQASHVATGDGGWGTLGWAVVAGWSVVLGLLAARAFVRDTRRR
jgi:ABC-2 type transport system permease protein